MTDKNQIPSRDPANDDSMVGMLRQVMDKAAQNTDDMLPARVIAFDRASNRVQIQPMIHVVTTSGQNVARAQVIDIPVMQFGGGDFVLLFNLKPGDFGWVKANDRDISLFLQSGSDSPPNTFRKHSFSDGVFIPDVMRGWTLDPEDAESAVLQSLDGSVRVALAADNIRMTVEGATLTLTADGLVSSVPITAPSFIPGA